MLVQLGGLTVTPLSTCIFFQLSFKAPCTGLLISSKVSSTPGKAESLPSIGKQQHTFRFLHSLYEEHLKACVISGDFFGLGDVKELENQLKGKSRKEIQSIDVSQYIDKMTIEEFCELIND